MKLQFTSAIFSAKFCGKPHILTSLEPWNLRRCHVTLQQLSQAKLLEIISSLNPHRLDSVSSSKGRFNHFSTMGEMEGKKKASPVIFFVDKSRQKGASERSNNSFLARSTLHPNS
ncbi:hypothetical protein I7I53_03436 [Histoplasma capsulatum var. duboisii H88]|uniref:Uncharacterized protein n=1 Tax=Ajellomyces capsulatus (strain H88) TaxID=544711 RepID=A0A8A1LSJ0_AJEC8|nr:hypothetical protein I7I53_03436 [Histoplasma capsulatum var. duboisii H88]